MSQKNGKPADAMSFEALRIELEKVEKEYETQSDDVVGYWVPETAPIHFVPKGARLIDGSQDPEKPSVLILGTLVSPTALVRRDEKTREWVPFVGGPGELVGVWGKWGMKGVRNCAGLKTVIRKTGKKIAIKGRSMPMADFSVAAERGGKPCPLPILEDRRDESRHARTFLDGSRSEADSPF